MSLHEPPGRASSASSSSLDGENRENLQNTTASLSLKNWLRHVSTEPAMLLYMCSVMIKFPVFQQLLYEKACWQKYAPENMSLCGNTTAVHADIDLQGEANRLLVASSLCLLLPSMVVALLLGSLLDMWSARRAMMIPFVGLILCDVNYIVQSANMDWSPYWLLVSDLLFGVAGGFTAIIGLLFAYSVRVTPVDYRSERVAIMEGCIGLGSMLGYFLSGQLRQRVGFALVFVVITVLHIVTVAHLLATVRDLPSSSTTASAHRRQTARLPHGGGGSSTALQPSAVQPDSPNYGACEGEVAPPERSGPLHLLRRHLHDIRDAYFAPSRDPLLQRRLRLLLLAFSLEILCFSGLLDIMFSYLRFQLSWTDKEYGWFNGVSSGLASFSVIFVYPFLHKQLGLSNARLSIAGLLGKALNLTVLAFTRSTLVAMLSVLPLAFGRFIATGMRAMASTYVAADDQQGKVFALIALLESVAFLLASLIFNGLYPITLHFFAGTMLLGCAIVLLVPAAMLGYLDYDDRRSQKLQTLPALTPPPAAEAEA